MFDLDNLPRGRSSNSDLETCLAWLGQRNQALALGRAWRQSHPQVAAVVVLAAAVAESQSCGGADPSWDQTMQLPHVRLTGESAQRNSDSLIAVTDRAPEHDLKPSQESIRDDSS